MGRRCVWNKIGAIIVASALFLSTATWAEEVPPIDGAGLSGQGRFSSVLPKNREEFLAYRRNKVKAIAHLGLFPDNYTPSEYVFGKITDSEPWTQSSGFYISNPHLLIIETITGQITPFVYVAPDGNDKNELTVRHNKKRIIVTYNDVSANHWFYWAFSAYGKPRRGNIRLWAPNARDAGFQYGMLDLEKSQNINEEKSGPLAFQAIKFKDYFYYGNNVNANSLSPRDNRMVLRLRENFQPTKIYLKLWRNKPASPAALEDFAYVIQINPNPEAADYGTSSWEELDDFWEEYNLALNFALQVLPFLLFIALGYFIGRYKERRHYKSIHRRESALLNIPTMNLEEYDNNTGKIAEVKLACGSTAVSVDYYKRILFFFRNLVGGEVKSYSSLVDRARREAILRMKESCPDCDIFINCRLQTSTITRGAGRSIACVEVIAYATALRYRR